MSRAPLLVAASLVAASSVLLAAALPGAGCAAPTPIELYADGFDPEQVRFEVEDLGKPGRAALRERHARGDVDGALYVDPANDAACGGPCRAVLVTIWIKNTAAPGAKDAAYAPPVVRIEAPRGRPARVPLSYRGLEISPGRTGRIRWLVELWPDERALTATVSSSVFLDVKEARE